MKNMKDQIATEVASGDDEALDHSEKIDPFSKTQGRTPYLLDHARPC
jgi:hypothetical protein